MRHFKDNLVLQFSVACFIALAIVGSTMILGAMARIEEEAVGYASLQALHHAEGPILAQLDPSDFEAPMTGARYDEFSRFIEEYIVSERTPRVKLWSLNGTVIFSNDPAGVGLQFPENEHLQKALQGELVPVLPGSLNMLSPEHETEQDLGRLMEVYAPLVFPGATAPQGVLEIYEQYEPIAQMISVAHLEITVTIIGSFSLLYIALVSIVWRGSKTINRQRAEILASNTELSRSLESLRESEHFAKTIISSVGQGILVSDRELRGKVWNECLERMTGVSPSEIEGEPVIEHLAGFNGNRIGQLMERALTGETVSSGDLACNAAPGGVHHWIEGTFSPHLSLAGDVVGVVGVMHDITDRKAVEVELQRINRRLERTVAELEEAQLKIVQQERLAAIGQLAAGVAHDFNNILVPITLYSEAMLNGAELTEKNRERLQVIFAQATRAASLTQQILDFTRRAVLELKPIDIIEFFEDWVEMMRRTLPESISIDLQHASEGYIVQADPVRLQQAIMNLALNARDAMGDGGEIRIHIARHTFGPDQIPPFGSMPDIEWVKIEVSDTGRGIPSEHLPHVFEPFFTTKEAGQGSGLGLAQVYGIIKQHGGYIDVTSQPGEGTTFILYLPPSDAEVESIVHENQETTFAENGGEAILVVEDNEHTRNAVCDTLKGQGYRVLEAGGADAAIEIYQRQPVDLVLTDLVMPKIGGVQLHDALLEVDAGVKMIIMTGYPQEQQGKELLERGIIAWIQKPVRVETLLKAIREGLDGDGSKRKGCIGKKLLS